MELQIVPFFSTEPLYYELKWKNNFTHLFHKWYLGDNHVLKICEHTILWHNDYTPSCIILLVFLITQSPLFDSVSWRINWEFVIILQKPNIDIVLGSEVARELDTLVNKMKYMRDEHFHTQSLYYSCLVCKTITTINYLVR